MGREMNFDNGFRLNNFEFLLLFTDFAFGWNIQKKKNANEICF